MITAVEALREAADKLVDVATSEAPAGEGGGYRRGLIAASFIIHEKAEELENEQHVKANYNAIFEECQKWGSN